MELDDLEQGRRQTIILETFRTEKLKGVTCLPSRRQVKKWLRCSDLYDFEFLTSSLIAGAEFTTYFIVRHSLIKITLKNNPLTITVEEKV